jgi:hypothetical protein
LVQGRLHAVTTTKTQYTSRCFRRGRNLATISPRCSAQVDSRSDLLRMNGHDCGASTPEGAGKAAALRDSGQAKLPHSKSLGPEGLSYNCSASGKQLAQDVVDGLWVGLAARGLHDLANEKLEHAFVAGFELGDVIGILADDITGSGFDVGIAHFGA